MRRLWATIQTHRPDTEVLRKVQAKSSRLETLRDSGGGEAMSVSDFYQVSSDAKKLELTATIGEGFDVVVEGTQQIASEWNTDRNRSEYQLKDVYDLTLNLSGNDGKRIGDVTVVLPGIEIELGNGWLSAKTDYGWKTYVEYDSPKTWKKHVLKEDSE